MGRSERQLKYAVIILAGCALFIALAQFLAWCDRIFDVVGK